MSRAPANTLVVKLGGRALEAPGAPDSLAAELAALGGSCVVVHGGGAEVSAWSRKLGLEPRYMEGLRVTDEATMEVAAAVLAGLANKRLVARLRATGVDAVGLAALDGGIVDALPHRDTARLGAVGRVRRVQPALIETLLAQGRTPVLASIAACDGQLLNLNADDLASAIAVALRAQVLVLLSDAPGLELDGAVVPRIEAGEVEAMLARPDVEGGMRPKLRAARAALAGGVRRVHIASWSGPATLRALVAGEPIGTTLEAGASLPVTGRG